MFLAWFRAHKSRIQIALSPRLNCYAGRCSLHHVLEKQVFVQDQQCVISAGPPVRRGHWAWAAGGHFSGPLRTTVNLQTIYPNKGHCVRRETRHRKQMNKQHQLPGPDLESPRPGRTFHTKWLQIGADKPGVERRGTHKVTHRAFLGARELGERKVDMEGGGWEVKEPWMKDHHNRSWFVLKWNKMAQFEHLAGKKWALVRYKRNIQEESQISQFTSM